MMSSPDYIYTYGDNDIDGSCFSIDNGGINSGNILYSYGSPHTIIVGNAYFVDSNGNVDFSVWNISDSYGNSPSDIDSNDGYYADYWWLRSPTTGNTYNACCVNSNGDVDYGSNHVWDRSYGRLSGV